MGKKNTTVANRLHKNTGSPKGPEQRGARGWGWRGGAIFTSWDPQPGSCPPSGPISQNTRPSAEAETARKLLPNYSRSGFSVGTKAGRELLLGFLRGGRESAALSGRQRSTEPGLSPLPPAPRRLPEAAARRARSPTPPPAAATITRRPARPSRPSPPPTSPVRLRGTPGRSLPPAPHRVGLHQLGTQDSGLPRGLLAVLAPRRRFHDAAEKRRGPAAAALTPSPLLSGCCCRHRRPHRPPAQPSLPPPPSWLCAPLRVRFVPPAASSLGSRRRRRGLPPGAGLAAGRGGSTAHRGGA